MTRVGTLRRSGAGDVIPIDVLTAEALFTEHRQQLFRYFYRTVGHAETARDLTQDVFVRVTRTSVPADDDAHVRAWLFRIARNLALDHHRQRTRRPEAPLPAVVATHAPQDVVVAINEALAQLSDVDRDVFLFREVVGLGYAEIAESCELTTDAVRNRLHRARLQLRDALAGPVATQRGRGVHLSHGEE